MKGFDSKFAHAAHIKTKSIGEIKTFCLNSEQGKKLWISVLVCVLTKRNESGDIKILYGVVVASLRCLVHVVDDWGRNNNLVEWNELHIDEFFLYEVKTNILETLELVLT